MEELKSIIWKKGSANGTNTNILLIAVTHMTSNNLRIPFLEVWKLAQTYHFWVG